MRQTFPPFGLPIPDTDEARARVLESEDKAIRTAQAALAAQTAVEAEAAAAAAAVAEAEAAAKAAAAAGAAAAKAAAKEAAAEEKAKEKAKSPKGKGKEVKDTKAKEKAKEKLEKKSAAAAAAAAAKEKEKEKEKRSRAEVAGGRKRKATEMCVRASPDTVAAGPSAMDDASASSSSELELATRPRSTSWSLPSTPHGSGHGHVDLAAAGGQASEELRDAGPEAIHLRLMRRGNPVKFERVRCVPSVVASSVNPLPVNTVWVPLYSNYRVKDEKELTFTPYFGDHDTTQGDILNDVFDVQARQKALDEGPEAITNHRKALYRKFESKVVSQVGEAGRALDQATKDLLVPLIKNTVETMTTGAAVLTTSGSDACVHVPFRVEEDGGVGSPRGSVTFSPAVASPSRAAKSPLVKSPKRASPKRPSSAASGGGGSGSAGFPVLQISDDDVAEAGGGNGKAKVSASASATAQARAPTALASASASAAEQFAARKRVRRAHETAYLEEMDSYRNLLCRFCFVYDCNTHKGYGVGQPSSLHLQTRRAIDSAPRLELLKPEPTKLDLPSASSQAGKAGKKVAAAAAAAVAAEALSFSSSSASSPSAVATETAILARSWAIFQGNPDVMALALGGVRREDGDESSATAKASTYAAPRVQAACDDTAHTGLSSVYEDYLERSASCAEAHGSFSGGGGVTGQSAGPSFEAWGRKDVADGEAQDGKAGKGKKGKVGHRRSGGGIGARKKGAKNSATARAANMHRALGRSDIATTAYVPYLPCRHAGSCSSSAGRMRGSLVFEGSNGKNATGFQRKQPTSAFSSSAAFCGRVDSETGEELYTHTASDNEPCDCMSGQHWCTKFCICAPPPGMPLTQVRVKSLISFRYRMRLSKRLRALGQLGRACVCQIGPCRLRRATHRHIVTPTVPSDHPHPGGAVRPQGVRELLQWLPVQGRPVHHEGMPLLRFRARM